MIDLPEGLYEVDQGYLVNGSGRRLPLRDVTFEIWVDKRGRKRLSGRSFINNLAFAELLEASERVDIVLCFFDDYFLCLREPVIQVGKVFEPHTEGSLLFNMGASTTFISRDEYLKLTGLA
ncbi:MAG: hypothetical protein ACLFVT_07375 [Syntrophobacteria bacterium]